MYCNPDVCPFCQYIGQGDSWCEEIDEIVLEDWEPTEYYMGCGRPLHGLDKEEKYGKTDHKKRRRKR